MKSKSQEDQDRITPRIFDIGKMENLVKEKTNPQIPVPIRINNSNIPR